MKTTLDLPDPLFRRARATAAARGQSLKAFVSDALHEKLAPVPGRGARSADPRWMRGFGGLRSLRRETARVQAVIDNEFEIVETEDRA